MYSSSAYYFANILSIIAHLWIYPVAGGIVAYYFFAIDDSKFTDCLYWLLGLLVIAWCGRMLGLAVGACVTDPLKALAISALVQMFATDTGGCFSNIGANASPIVVWLSNITPVRYSLEIQMRRLT